MEETPKEEGKPPELQFDRAEPAAEVPPPQGAAPVAPPTPAAGVGACAFCGRPFADAYFSIGDKLLCAQCRAGIEAHFTGGSRAARFARASLLGLLAAAGGAAVWYGVAWATNAHWGIVAIVVGVVVGKAVRHGTGGRGGLAYQLLAAFLTYSAIAASYGPEVYQGLEQVKAERKAKEAANGGAPDADAPPPKLADWPRPIRVAVGVVMLIGFMLAVPVIVGVRSIMGLIIIGIALYEAWKMNTPVRLVFGGPFRAGPAGATSV